MKRPILQYTFDPTAKTLTFGSIPSFDVRKLLFIANLRTCQDLYLPATPGLGYTTVVGDVLTLAAATTGMLAGDPLLIFYETAGVYEDHSGTITTGSLDQVAVAADPDRIAGWLTNPTTATESLFVNFDTAASAGAASQELLPGGSISIETGQAVHVFAATLGHAYGLKVRRP